MVFIIFIICGCLFTIITFFRIYRRTGLRCHLFIFLGGIVSLIGVFGTFGFAHIKNELLSDWFGYLFMIPGGILAIIGAILLYTIESGAVQDAYYGHSILDIILGNVSMLEEKKYRPALGRTTGMLLGFMATVGGIAQSLDATSKMPYSGIYLIIFGLAIFFVSLIALNGKDKTKEEMETTSKLVPKKGNLAWGRNIAIALGFIGISVGIYKCFNAYPSLSYSGIYLIALGLIAFVIMLIVLKGNNKKNRERK